MKAALRLWRGRVRGVNLKLLRLSLRLVPSERRRVFGLTLIAGVVCGLAAVAFHLALRGTEHLLVDRAMAASGHKWIVLTICVPTIGGLVGGALLQYVVPDARGSGIPQVKVAYVVKGGRMALLSATIGKFILGVIQIGTGASLGREGPTVQICAGLASMLGRAAALSRDNLRRMLPVGAAAGIAAAFNAPIAAVTFTIEEVVGDLDQTMLSGVIVAAALAAVIERSVLGEHPVFDVPAGYGLHHASSLLLYAVLGVAAAFVSLAFTESLLGLRKGFQRLNILPAWTRPAVGGLVTGVMAVIALAWLRTGGVTAGGYETLSLALAGQLTMRVLLALCVLKLIATVFSYGSGGAGGIFAPSLFIGGMLGGAVGYLDHALLGHTGNEVGAFALVGMGAVFAGIVRAPITSVLIIFEMTGGYGLILPLMIANMTAYGLARRLRPTPIYEALLEQDGVHLPHRDRPLARALAEINIGAAMTTAPVTLRAKMTVQAALDHVAKYNFSTYPVLDGAEQLAGLVSEARLRRRLAEGDGARAVGELVEAVAPVFAGEPLVRAVVRMERTNMRQLPVVEADEPARLVGLLTMSDVVRAQARAAREADGAERPVNENFGDVREMIERP
jgi:CIC family chloride channel protein